MIPVNLAIEDELSEVVLRRLLQHANRGYAVGTAYGRSGFGYLRKTIAGWNRAARGRPFIVLTDLDTCACPSLLLQQWLSSPAHPNLLLRVAVREVEAWLLADGSGLSDYLKVNTGRMPVSPDELADPKKTIINLARTSRSADIRARIVPRSGSTATQGPDYNACLCAFVSGRWDINLARQNSPSLNRTVHRLAVFEPTWGT